MGTWDASISGNDTFNDIYHFFFSFYNMGHKPVSISKQVVEEFGEMLHDYEDRNNALFGLAMAQWETKSLDPEILQQVKEIIGTGSDLKLWKSLDADEETLGKRKIVLEEFLHQITTEREKPKRRVKPKFDFKSIELISLSAPDNNKIFSVKEHYVNGVYEATRSMMNWETGGGGIFHFKNQEMYIAAKWLDSQILEITHDKNIVFADKSEEFFYCGDKGKIFYVAKE